MLVVLFQDLDDINAKLMQAFLVFPHYCLGRGLIDVTRNQLIADVFAGFGECRLCVSCTMIVLLSFSSSSFLHLFIASMLMMHI